MNGKLLIARHQESEWNKLGKWTGRRDRHLTDYGFEKANEMGTLIKDIPIDFAFASMQVRAIETLSCILSTNNEDEIPAEHNAALDEVAVAAAGPFAEFIPFGFLVASNEELSVHSDGLFIDGVFRLATFKKVDEVLSGDGGHLIAGGDAR